MRRFAVGVAFSIAAALVAGVIYQAAATRSDVAKYPPPGQMVETEGRSLHINCTGVGSSTVILESGLGGGSLDWSLVQPEVARAGRVCSYDRAGIVWSSEGEGPRTATKIVNELHKLLEAARIPPPYVLVGHSVGGVYVQMFAARFPDEVAGVVLVDSSHQDQLSRVPGIPSVLPYLFKAAAPFGVARLINQVVAAPPNLSPEANAARAGMYSHTHTVFAIADEMAAIPESLAELRTTPMQLGAKPLIVLSRGLSDGASPENEAAWRELQADLARCSSSGKQVVAQKSGHYIQFAEPELVIDAIRQVIRAVATDQ